MKTHPDEDTITAFVEARLGAQEYAPVISHLIDCRVCRSTTAQLVRLETELEDSEAASALDEHPSRLSSFLTDLASHLVPSTEGDAVFAYQNPETIAEESTESVANSEAGDKDKKAT